jgi:tellurite methyltransferase
MADSDPGDPPSPFLSAWIARLADPTGKPRALDVAMGRGRHALALARAGFRAYGVDRRLDAVRDAVARAVAEGLTVRAWVADLARHPLPDDHFDLLVVARYLQRDLFGALRATVAPGGVVLYETFADRQRRHGRGPSSADHLLRPGELKAAFEGFEVLFYEEVDDPEAVARIAARRPAVSFRRSNSPRGSVTLPGAAGPCDSSA